GLLRRTPHFECLRHGNAPATDRTTEEDQQHEPDDPAGTPDEMPELHLRRRRGRRKRNGGRLCERDARHGREPEERGQPTCEYGFRVHHTLTTTPPAPRTYRRAGGPSMTDG